MGEEDYTPTPQENPNEQSRDGNEGRIQERIQQLPEPIRSTLGRMDPGARMVILFSDESLLNEPIDEIEKRCREWGLDKGVNSETKGSREVVEINPSDIFAETLQQLSELEVKFKGLKEQKDRLSEIKREMEVLKQRFQQNREQLELIKGMPEGKGKLTEVIKNSQELQEIFSELLKISNELGKILGVESPLNSTNLGGLIEKNRQEVRKGEELLTIADLGEGGFIDDEEEQRLLDKLKEEGE